MTVSEAVSGILADAKKRGIRSVNVRISDRHNRRGKYGYLEVAYIVPYKQSSQTIESPPDPLQYFDQDLSVDEIAKQVVEAFPDATEVSDDPLHYHSKLSQRGGKHEI